MSDATEFRSVRAAAAAAAAAVAACAFPVVPCLDPSLFLCLCLSCSSLSSSLVPALAALEVEVLAKGRATPVPREGPRGRREAHSRTPLARGGLPPAGRAEGPGGCGLPRALQEGRRDGRREGAREGQPEARRERRPERRREGRCRGAYRTTHARTTHRHARTTSSTRSTTHRHAAPRIDTHAGTLAAAGQISSDGAQRAAHRARPQQGHCRAHPSE